MQPRQGSVPLPTPPGFNKHRRDISKFLLLLVVFFLLANHTYSSFVAVACSVGCIFTLKEGTLWSTKNIKWMTLALISFGASLSSAILLHLRDGILDPETDQGNFWSFLLWASAKWIQLGWGIPLSLFLLSAWLSSSSSSSSTAIVEPAQSRPYYSSAVVPQPSPRKPQPIPKYEAKNY
ncbi:hypothetical protein ACA910_018698 [Epithemia clementina (nom. ined.)]